MVTPATIVTKFTNQIQLPIPVRLGGNDRPEVVRRVDDIRRGRAMQTATKQTRDVAWLTRVHFLNALMMLVVSGSQCHIGASVTWARRG